MAPSWVATAGHCLNRPVRRVLLGGFQVRGLCRSINLLIQLVRAGRRVSRAEEEEEEVQNIAVSQATRHPDYAVRKSRYHERRTLWSFCPPLPPFPPCPPRPSVFLVLHILPVLLVLLTLQSPPPAMSGNS